MDLLATLYGTAAEVPVLISRFFCVLRLQARLFVPGSTWMEEIVSLIFTGGDVSRVATVPVYERVPCLEERPVGTRVPNRRLLDAAAGPRVMKTRLPWSMVPPQVRQGKGKVIMRCNFENLEQAMSDKTLWGEICISLVPTSGR